MELEATRPVETLDRKRIDRLGGGDPARRDRLIALFLEQARDTVQRIHDTGATCDWITVGRLAHTLKGMAANLGAAALSDAAAGLEHATREGDEEGARATIARLDERLTELLAQLPEGS